MTRHQTNDTSLRPAGWLARHFGARCPGCGRRGYVVRTGTQQVGTTVEVRRETRTAHHERGPWATLAGERGYVGSTSYEVDVPYDVPLYHTGHRCQSCGHVWTTAHT